jgi:hypothetical protein
LMCLSRSISSISASDEIIARSSGRKSPGIIFLLGSSLRHNWLIQ